MPGGGDKGRVALTDLGRYAIAQFDGVAADPLLKIEPDFDRKLVASRQGRLTMRRNRINFLTFLTGAHRPIQR